MGAVLTLSRRSPQQGQTRQGRAGTGPNSNPSIRILLLLAIASFFSPPQPTINAEDNTSFWSSFQHEFLSRCRVNSRLVTILTSLPFSDFFLDLADGDLTEYQITQVLTAYTSGANKGNQTVHTHNALRSDRQGESDCLTTVGANRKILRSMQCESVE